jgi:hypothetical protein
VADCFVLRRPYLKPAKMLDKRKGPRNTPSRVSLEVLFHSTFFLPLVFHSNQLAFFPLKCAHTFLPFSTQSNLN